MFDPPSARYSGIDTLPLLAQAKIAYQLAKGDTKGAAQTWDNFSTYSLLTSQLHSVYDWASGQRALAVERQREFVRGAARAVSAIPENAPVLGHFVGTAHCCLGDPKRGSAAMRRSSRSCGVLAAGGAVWCAASQVAAPAVFAPSAAGALAAGSAAAVAGVAAGLAADFLWGGAPSIPRPLSAGEQFDWMALRFLDALRGISGMDLAAVLLPEHITHISIWTEPISAADVARLVTSRGGQGGLPWFDHVSSGIFHAYVLIKTDKGRLLVTERVHDGRVLVEDLAAGSLVPFAHGHQLAGEPLAALDRAARHAAAHAAPSAHAAAGASAHGGVAAHGSPAVGAAAAHPAPSALGASASHAPAPTAGVRVLDPPAVAKVTNGPELFADKVVVGGPSVADVAKLAQSQSVAGYDIFQSNCQHYADSVYTFVGGHSLQSLPNEEWLSLFRAIWPQKSLRVPKGTMAGEALWNAQQAPLRVAVVGSLALWPARVSPEQGPGMPESGIEEIGIGEGRAEED